MKYIVYLTTNLQEKAGELNRIYDTTKAGLR